MRQHFSPIALSIRHSCTNTSNNNRKLYCTIFANNVHQLVIDYIHPGNAVLSARVPVPRTVDHTRRIAVRLVTFDGGQR